MMAPEDMRPVGETEFLISWPDGHRSLYSFFNLRLNCPCAGCRDEWTNKPLITADKIPLAVKAREIVPVGRYALRFLWSDRHETGIYSFDFLRGICPCETCQKAKKEKT